MPNAPKFDDVAGDLRKRGEDAMQSFGRAALETGRGPMATLAGVALLGFAAGVAASLSKKAATEVAIGAVGDWVEALAAEHRQIEGLFEQILTTLGGLLRCQRPQHGSCGMSKMGGFAQRMCCRSGAQTA